MASTTRSQSKTEDPLDDFLNQGLVRNPEPCSLFQIDIDRLESSKAFPLGTKFRPFDPALRPDHCSKKWLCFPEFPFNLGLSFPFPPLFEQFFATTGLAYSQTMPMVWRTLFTIQNLIQSHSLDFGIPELAYVYNLRSHGSCYFLFQVKSGHSHLILRCTQNDPNWKGRYFFVERKSIPGGDLLPSCWIQKAKFSELAPATQDTEKKVAVFLSIPAEERTFHHPSKAESSGSLEAEPAMSGSQRSSSRFTLSELDSGIAVKKEKISGEPSKPRIPSLRSSAKKRKTNEVINVEESSLPRGAEEMVKNVHLAFGEVVKFLNEKINIIEDLQKIADSKSKIMEKEVAENAKLKKEVEDLKALHTKEMESLKAGHSKELEDFLDDVKRDAAIAIFEARIKMSSEAAAKDFDISIWDTQTWKAKLVELKGEDPEAKEDEEAAAVTMEVVKDLEGVTAGDEGNVE